MTTDYPDWTRALLLLGKSGADLIPVALDASGNLYAILQGEYAGALRTVKLDSEGRLTAYVADSVDQWGNVINVGNAELSARIVGLPVSYDRRGQVLYVERFGHGFGPWTIETFAGGQATITPTGALEGGYCVDVTADGAGDLEMGINAYCPRPVLTSPVGLAMYIAPYGNFSSVQVNFMGYYAPYFYECKARLTRPGGLVQLYDANNTWVTVGTYDVNSLLAEIWHYVKFVANLSALAYVRVIYDGVEYDASSIDIHRTASVQNYARVDVHLLQDAGAPGHLLVDCIVITNQEP